jgi:uncharacterized glyoxalase superfamily protein PhnB
VAYLGRVAPELPVRDLMASLGYYTSRLGFEVVTVMRERAYAIVERDAVALHLFASEPAEHRPVSLHVFVGDLDGLFDELESRGADITQAIAAQPWGSRDFRVADPSGNVLKFTEAVD